ncbi:HAD-IA family hydrolase [Citreicella sp. C3M06]|uniref:HAD family hydrolase n=1 Tax=Citreicella sp. C3M06 TaxID=2841564 RepID=UPI001C092FD7|nr:HAD-IA family hydrolase [Citreicella sp. C3M06]MBU2962171.1 HAD-IA family hydrolase [Citreicella sp. C3M06]
MAIAGSKALLFDLDGTLLLSDPLHYQVFAEMFAERGKTLTQQIYETQIHGNHNLDSFPKLFPGEDPQALSDEKEARFRDSLGHGTAPMPGAEALLDRADREGWRLAVVTNAPRENGEYMLEAIGLRKRFELLIIGDECARAKPDPEPYLLAMRELGVRPQDCILFEDSPSGMRAAARSGGYAVGIRSGLPEDRLREAGAKITIADYEDPALEGILARLSA